jgi:hypothetical protein
MNLINDFQHKVLNAATRMSFLAAFVITATVFTACDDDDDNGIGSVAGNWRGNKTELTILVEGVPTPINETDDSFAGEVEFKSNGTAVYTEDGEEIIGTWSQNNNKLTLTIPDDSQELDMSGVYTIQELSGSKLKLYIEKEGSFEDPDTGFVFDATIKATLYFDKN